MIILCNVATLSTGVGLKITTKKAKLTDTFKCEISELYNVFVNEEVL